MIFPVNCLGHYFSILLLKIYGGPVCSSKLRDHVSCPVIDKLKFKTNFSESDLNNRARQLLKAFSSKPEVRNRQKPSDAFSGPAVGRVNRSSLSSLCGDYRFSLRLWKFYERKEIGGAGYAEISFELFPQELLAFRALHAIPHDRFGANRKQ